MPNPTQSKPSRPIPYGKQTIGPEEWEAVRTVLASDFLTQGPTIERFEKAVAEYCKVPYAVAFSNGTTALHAAYFAAGLGKDDAGITTPNTFVATSNAMMYEDAIPVFADIHPESFNLDINEAAKKITSKTKVISPVHFAGQPVDLDAFYALADKHNLVVIEDACHALGAWYNNKPIGQCRDMAVFSFHPVKSITTGEGGMVVTPHRNYYEKLLQFRTHGITKDTQTFQMLKGEPWEYEMQELGNNYRMTDIQAALGVVQMGKLDGFIQRRNEIAENYRKAFEKIPAIRMQNYLANTRSSHHLFPIVLDPTKTKITRRELFDHLVAQNIRPQVHYIPVHIQPYYQKHLQTKPGMFPQAEAYYQNCLSLPIYPMLSNDEQNYVIETCIQFLK